MNLADFESSQVHHLQNNNIELVRVDNWEDHTYGLSLLWTDGWIKKLGTSNDNLLRYLLNFLRHSLYIYN